MDVEASCKCGHALTVKDPFEGMVILCPKCGGPMAVPQVQPEKIAPRVISTRTRVRRLLIKPGPPWVTPLAAGLILCAIAGGVVVWQHSGASTARPPDGQPARKPAASTASAPKAPPVIEEPPEIRPPDLPERPGFIRTGPHSKPPEPAPPESAASGPEPPSGDPAPAPAAPARRVVASSKATKYHRPDCEWAQKISKDNRVEYDSPTDAERADLKPCGVCRPERD